VTTTPQHSTQVADQPDEQARAALYEDFAAARLMPLWTQRADLMPVTPQPQARPYCWRWSELYPIAERSGALIPVGRGGERRAIALANPGLGGQPYATPTLWAAIQFLGPHETAPAHHHTQTAFRFVVEGEGVWTNVDGDPVAMRRGDLLLTPSWAYHEHHNTTDRPMAWLDGLDIPLVSQLDAGFFEFGPDRLETTATPRRSRGERLWGHPGLRPAVGGDTASSPLNAYRWEHTDAALAEQLAVEREGYPATIEPGHALVRFVHPGTGRDALTTIRTEMHRLAAGTRTQPRQVVGSAVWQVFQGEAEVSVGPESYHLTRGDLFVVPSWAPVSISASDGVDLFRFSDEPVYEALGLARTSVEGTA
jgi:gentisate 1,2-dioxygenase